MAVIDVLGGQMDDFDRKLLHEIQRDGRAPVVELAERIGLSKTPCQKRLRRLEREGVIRGYRAEIAPEKIDCGYLVFVQVKLDSTTTDKLERFNTTVKAIPEIMSCHMLSGGYDYLLKVRTRNMTTYRALLGDVIAQLPGVAQTSTFPVMEEVKDSSALSILPE